MNRFKKNQEDIMLQKQKCNQMKRVMYAIGSVKIDMNSSFSARIDFTWQHEQASSHEV